MHPEGTRQRGAQPGFIVSEFYGFYTHDKVYAVKDAIILYMKYLIPTLVIALPAVTFAQGLQQYLGTLPAFINDTLMPFLIGASFIFVAINVIRYFVIDINSAGNKDKGTTGGKAKAKAYVLYSIMAFVVILVLFGVINLLVGATGLEGNDAPMSDYMAEFGGDCFTGDPIGDCICAGGDPHECAGGSTKKPVEFKEINRFFQWRNCAKEYCGT